MSLKKLGIFIILLMLINGCKERAVTANQLKNRDGIFYDLKEEKPFTGIEKNYYETGQLKSERVYAEGRLEGIWKRYSIDGLVCFEGNYRDGKLEGVRKTYYDTGELESERFYIDGKFNGVGNYYLKNGDIIKVRN